MFENLNEEAKQDVYRELKNWITEDNKHLGSRERYNGWDEMDFVVLAMRSVKAFLMVSKLDHHIIPGTSDLCDMTKEQYDEFMQLLDDNPALGELFFNLRVDFMNMRGSAVRWSTAVMAAMLYKDINGSSEDLDRLAEQILKGEL